VTKYVKPAAGLLGPFLLAAVLGYLGYVFARPFTYVSIGVAVWGVANAAVYTGRVGQWPTKVAICAVPLLCFSAVVSAVHSAPYAKEASLVARFSACYKQEAEIEACLSEGATLSGYSKGFVASVVDWKASFPVCNDRHGVKYCVRGMFAVEADLDGAVSPDDILSMCQPGADITECLLRLRREGFPFESIVIGNTGERNVAETEGSAASMPN
jgi:hypothetical protein